jgi:hypothetical protein
MTAPRKVSIDMLGEHQPSADQFARLLEARAWVGDHLLARDLRKRPAAAGMAGYDNIVGAAIGLKQRGGKRLSQVGVSVYVRRKLPLDKVATEARVPPEIGGIPTDVEETGEVRAGAAIQPAAPPTEYQQRHRPTPAGVSTIVCDHHGAGTIAGLVRDAQGRTYLLSNNHVLARANQSPLNTGVAQPGLTDAGVCPADVVANLSKFIQIEFGSFNFVDAAIAQVVVGSCIPQMRRQGNNVQLNPPVTAPALGLAVQKSGRTTGWTTGTIVAVDAQVTVTYADFGRGDADFISQTRIQGNAPPFSARGDSGSLVTTVAGDHPVGLLFTSDNAGSFANDLDMVLRDLGNEIPQLNPLTFVYV